MIKWTLIVALVAATVALVSMTSGVSRLLRYLSTRGVAHGAAREACRGRALGESPEPGRRLLAIVAHEDDDLLFMNPTIAHAIAEGAFVETVYVTAGDAGRDADYWRSREDGVRAAYALMACQENDWTASLHGFAGKSLQVWVLKRNRRVSLIFLRLPDGNGDGRGFGSADDDRFRPPRASLYRLWSGQLDSLPVLGTWSTPDGASYTAAELTRVLAAVMRGFSATEIATLDGSSESAGGQDFFYGREHSDHLHVGKLVFQAHLAYAARHVLTSYRDYNISDPPRTVEPANLSPADRDEKFEAYAEYAGYDDAVCLTGADCPVPAWLWREYPIRQVTAESGWLQLAGRCLSASPPRVTLAECAPVAEQRWTLDRHSVRVTLPDQESCLTWETPSHAAGPELRAAGCSPGEARQKWTLDESGLLRGGDGRCATGSRDGELQLAACRRRELSRGPLRYGPERGQSWALRRAPAEQGK